MHASAEGGISPCSRNPARLSASTSARAPIKAVELKPAGKGYRVAAFGTEPVPPDSIVDGAIIDGAAVADAIRRVFESKAFKAKEVAASLSGNAVIVKKISLPVMTATELDESIYWEAEQYIPFDIQDVNLDYQILDAGPGADAKGTMEVLLVAAKKDKIADYTGVIDPGGPDAGGRRRRRLRAAERLRAQLRLRARRRGRPAECRRQRHQHQHHRQRSSRSSRATSRWAATRTPRPCSVS